MLKKVTMSKDNTRFAIDGQFFDAMGLTPPEEKFTADGVLYYPLPYTLSNVKKARSKGYSVRSPIHTQYEWVGSLKPLDHQRVTSAFFTLHDRGYCLNGLGSGKTLSALWAMDYLINIGDIKRILIISPLSTLPDAWERTLFNHFPRLKTHVVHGAGKNALVSTPEKFKNIQIFLTNHEFARSSSRCIFMGKGKLPVDLVIVDEGASFRALSTEKSKGLKAIVKDVPKVWWLTATPIPNSPLDAWMQADIMGTRDNISFASFRDVTMRRVTEYHWEARPEAPTWVEKILSPYICFRTEDCIDLPGITYQNRIAIMSPEQKKVYSKLSRDAFIELTTGGTATALNEGIKANKLLQVACGLLYTDDNGVAEVAAVDKLKIMEEIMDEADTPIILFAPYRSVVRHLAEKFSKYKPEIILGDVNISERKRIFDAVQSGVCRLLVAHPRTMSHGITLTRSACIVWYAPVYSNDTYEQANGRIYRQGQTKHCNIIHITSCEVEKEIYRRLEHRQSMQGALLDVVRRNCH